MILKEVSSCVSRYGFSASLPAFLPRSYTAPVSSFNRIVPSTIVSPGVCNWSVMTISLANVPSCTFVTTRVYFTVSPTLYSFFSTDFLMFKCGVFTHTRSRSSGGVSLSFNIKVAVTYARFSITSPFTQVSFLSAFAFSRQSAHWSVMES